ncbi:MAG: DegV family protein [Corallococcus sp.]|nr:DegV family protein [Corallococcus sp.]MCM1359244.1 DegV family protein [Corallococcus sp.]MCM1394635.1 DegV family protein [Corallococcus sp.]
MKIKISADSTCDLSKELLEKYNVGIMPLFVALGENNLLDGESIAPDDIYEYYNRTKKLPKSASRSVDDYYDFFCGLLNDGYDAVVHFTISADMSASFDNAAKASEKLKNVFVVDSRSLSTGIGLLVLDACDMVAQGKSAKYISERAEKRIGAVEASFVIDSLEFLYKGGRCSSLAYFGANLLQLKPSIIVKDGKMGTWNKFQGKYERCVQKYVETVRKTYVNPDKKRCFVTHTALPAGIAESVVETVKSWGIFDEVLETFAGCTVTTHCGAGTIGVLFINDGGIG